MSQNSEEKELGIFEHESGPTRISSLSICAAVHRWATNKGLRLLNASSSRRNSRCSYCHEFIVPHTLILGHYGIKWGHVPCIYRAFNANELMTSTFNAAKRPEHLLYRLLSEKKQEKREALNVKADALLPPGAVYAVGEPHYVGEMPVRKIVHVGLDGSDFSDLEGTMLTQMEREEMRDWTNAQLQRLAMPAHMLGIDPGSGPAHEQTVMTKLNRNGDTFAFVQDPVGKQLSPTIAEQVCKNMTDMFDDGCCAGPAEHINVEVKLQPSPGVRCPFFEPRLVGKVCVPGARRPYHTLKSTRDGEKKASWKLELQLWQEEKQRAISHYLARTNEFPCCPEHGPAEFELGDHNHEPWEAGLWLVCRTAGGRTISRIF